MNSSLRFTKRVLQTVNPLVISARGSVVDKCTPHVPKRAKKIKVLQQRYQNAENKKPIYLKGGIKDQILYRLTMLLCVVGVGMQVVEFYHMAKPPG